MRNGLIYQLLGDVNFNTKNYQKVFLIMIWQLNILKKMNMQQQHILERIFILKMNNIDDACADFKIAYKLGGENL